METVERGILMSLGRLVPDLTIWARRRWSYAQRVQGVVVGVSSITKASPALTQQASQKANDIRRADVAYTKMRNVCAHSWSLCVALDSVVVRVADIFAADPETS